LQNHATLKHWEDKRIRLQGQYRGAEHDRHDCQRQMNVASPWMASVSCIDPSGSGSHAMLKQSEANEHQPTAIIEPEPRRGIGQSLLQAFGFASASVIGL
jgi:hypothetical protein